MNEKENRQKVEKKRKKSIIRVCVLEEKKKSKIGN